ncbi:histidine kinase N-terminal 7TM domain-containing protein [Halorientalis salina]|uniref:histidine kinase N-terminal 7TM domain-containing protein n=1 Tax=Halorientalis salina TaxID=2932266 RepID=UPI0010AB8FE3|nr:histidine kinase N-terminal 7TM domain-containing protein [Halorientalis salina]
MVTSALWLGGYLLGVLAMAAFGYLYWTKRNVTGMSYLLVAALVGTVQSLLYLMLLVAPVLPTKVILWQLFGVLGAIVVFFWYLFCVAWTGRYRLARRPTLIAVALPLFLGSLLLVTNASPVYDGVHSLYFSSVEVADASALASPLTVSFGPVALAASGYATLLVAASTGLLAEFALRDDQQLYRWRNTMVTLAGVTAVLFGVGFAFLEMAFEPQPLVYVLANGFVVLGIVRSGTYDVVSLPENALIEAIEGGVLVYNNDGTVIELNEAAERLLGFSDDIVGRGIVAVVELAEQLPGVRSNADADGATAADPAAIAALLDGHEFTTTVGDTNRTFLVRVSELTDEGGHGLGWTVLFYDVTDLRQKQHELDLLKQVLSRVLRHNVRNDLSVVKANAQMLEDEASGLSAERLQTIQDKSDNLLDASEKARTVERLLEGDRSRSELDAVDIVADAVGTVRSEFPGVDFEVSLPETCSIRAHWALSQAVENVVENAAMHNDSPDPKVTVSLDRAGGTVTLTVADNGPGIPYSELEVLDRKEETALEHGSSVGLWLIDWIVDLSQGDIDFENTDRGCTVTMRLEHAEAGAEPAAEEADPLGLGIGGSADDD